MRAMDRKRKTENAAGVEEGAENPAVIIVGNPCDGFTLFGPFRTSQEANDWADGERELSNAEWWVSTMTPQKKRQVSFSGVEIEVDGGCVQDCQIELQCPECGAVTNAEDGYQVNDNDKCYVNDNDKCYVEYVE